MVFQRPPLEKHYSKTSPPNSTTFSDSPFPLYKLKTPHSGTLDSS